MYRVIFFIVFSGVDCCAFRGMIMEWTVEELIEGLQSTDSWDFYRGSENFMISQMFAEFFSLRELHDEYSSYREQNTHYTHQQCYNFIRLFIYRSCLQKIMYKPEAIEAFENWEDEQHRLFIDHLIKHLFLGIDDIVPFFKYFNDIVVAYENYQSDGNPKQIEETSLIYTPYKYKDEEFEWQKNFPLSNLMNKIDSACSLSSSHSKQLNEHQKKLIAVFKEHFLYFTPLICMVDNSLGFELYEQEYAMEESVEMYNVIFRLYLMGEDSNISPNAYRNAILGNDSPRKLYEDFILWFWKWAQKRKSGKKNPTADLKEFCCLVLGIVSDNNSSSRHNSKEYKNPSNGWELFRKQNEYISGKRRVNTLKSE